MNYNYIAPYYDWLSRICFLNRQQLAHRPILKYLKPHDRILWIGGGSGWFLREINQLNIPLTIDYVELSETMIQKAQSKVYEHLNINFIAKDMFIVQYEGRYDVVLSAFIFDHFMADQCQTLFKKINLHLRQEGIWFYVDFSENQNLVQKALTKAMVTFFNLVANIKNSNFPKINHLFKDFVLIEKKEYFGKYIEAKIYKK